jgi:hypothetical protein
MSVKEVIEQELSKIDERKEESTASLKPRRKRPEKKLSKRRAIKRRAKSRVKTKKTIARMPKKRRVEDPERRARETKSTEMAKRVNPRKSAPRRKAKGRY